MNSVVLYEKQNEEALIRCAQQGDRNAFAQLYEDNVERVHRYLLSRLVEPADAEDVTTEVFINAIKSLPSYKPQGTPLIGWLFRIAHNQAVNHIKKSTRRKEAPLSEDVAIYDGPEEDVLHQLRFGEVAHAMEDLTNLQRQVLNLRFAAELSISEVAAIMSREEGAVKFLQYSALRALRKVWGSQEVGSHGN